MVFGEMDVNMSPEVHSNLQALLCGLSLSCRASPTFRVANFETNFDYAFVYRKYPITLSLFRGLFAVVSPEMGIHHHSLESASGEMKACTPTFTRYSLSHGRTSQ